ncbi:haloacid dehalogenase [Saccharopolyspora sp. 5N708]|uniref:haloacid dehalogenase n=1 Tax=Saccharopolyspora sp. 5N708 TaxID=3457424 RepID=UPI003FD6ACED
MIDRRAVVTFDLFSALTDSRSGGSAQFEQLAARHGWAVAGVDVYDRWDALNKAAQRDCARWRPFRELSGEALAATYRQLDLAGDPAADAEVLLDSVGNWPLWPDVQTSLAALAKRYRLGILSNVDDDIAARTRAVPLVSPDLVFTSQRLQTYKPGRRIYTEAARLAGSLVHVATSGRDVAGALRAGVPVVRLRRPGHAPESGSPKPAVEIADLTELAARLRQPSGFTPDPSDTGFPE